MSPPYPAPPGIHEVLQSLFPVAARIPYVLAKIQFPPGLEQGVQLGEDNFWVRHLAEHVTEDDPIDGVLGDGAWDPDFL